MSVVVMFQDVERLVNLYCFVGYQKIALVELLNTEVLALTVPHSKDQFEGHSFNRRKGLHDDGTQEVPKHVVNCVSVVFTF